MTRKTIAFLGAALLVFSIMSCSSQPEKDLLKRYFHAISLNDVNTMSSMALESRRIEAESWKILNVTETEIAEAPLVELNKKELEFKKQLEDHIGVTLDASDDLDNAKFELDNARSRSARRRLQAQVDELQKKYDEIYAEHKDLQKNYNEAKQAAQDEETVTAFSLHVQDLPGIRDFTGEVHSKTVDISVALKDGTSRSFRVYLKRYQMEDTTSGMTRRGRWIILKFEPLE